MLSDKSVVLSLPESVLAKLVSLLAALAKGGSDGDSMI